MYKALKNITGDELIVAGTENLAAADLGGAESVERLLAKGAIEEMKPAKTEKPQAEKQAEKPAEKENK